MSKINTDTITAEFLSLTKLEQAALKSALEASDANGHDFGCSDEILVEGKSPQAVGALITNLIKKEWIVDLEFTDVNGEYEVGQFILLSFDEEERASLVERLTALLEAHKPITEATCKDMKWGPAQVMNR